MLITEEYRKQNYELHKSLQAYGTGLKFNAQSLISVCEEMKTTDVLDYGCGKAGRALSGEIPFKIKLYDPAIPEYTARPEPADIVLCLAVLEHVEPECLDEVIKDLYRVTKKFGIFLVDLKEGSVKLPNGQLAHCSIHTIDQWTAKFQRYFDVLETKDFKNGKGRWFFVHPRMNLLEMGPTEEEFAPMDGEPVDLMNYKMVEFGEYQPINFFPAHLEHSLKTIPTHFSPDPNIEIKEEKIAIVGYGPSLRDTWEKIKDYKTIMTCSGAHQFLLEKDIAPTYHVEIDWKPHKPKFTKITHPDCTYLISAVCHPETINNVKDRKCELVFINHGPQITYPEGSLILEPGYDVGQQALVLALKLGYRNFDLFGFDYCFDLEKVRHAGDHGGRIHCAFPAKVGDKIFYTSKTMFAALLVFEYFFEKHPEMHLQVFSDTLLLNFMEQRMKEINNVSS